LAGSAEVGRRVGHASVVVFDLADRRGLIVQGRDPDGTRGRYLIGRHGRVDEHL